MNKTFVAAAAAFALMGAASAASATTFTGSYGVTANTSDSAGLPITITDATPGPLSGNNFSFGLTSVNQQASVNLFTISTNQGDLDNNDGNDKAISVTFHFTSPSNVTGGVSGVTDGETDVTFLGYVEKGVLDWSNNGDTLLNFGSAGQLLVHLNDVDFNVGSPSWFDPDLGNHGGLVTGTFTLKAPTSSVSAVPEPMSWALMLTGFMGLGAALRFSRRQGVALTAA